MLTADDNIRRRHTRAARDFFILAAFTLALGVLCLLFNLNDRFRDLLRRHTGSLEMDEFVLIGVVMSVGLALFSIRRWLDLRQELAKRRQIEEALQQRTGFVQWQQVLATAINEAGNIDEALQAALDLVCAYTGWPAGRALLRTPDNQRFTATQVWHVPDSPRYAPLRQSTEADLAACEAHFQTRMNNNGASFWITELVPGSGCPGLKIAVDLGLKASVMFPVWAGKEVVAVLEFFSPTLEPPDKNLQQVLGYTGTSLGRAIERDRAEEALRRSENAFRSLIDNSSDVIVVLNPDGTYRYCSPSIQRILGYEPRELIARNAFDFIHPQDVPAVRQVFLENVRELGRSDCVEFRFRHRDGSWRLFDAIGTNLLGDPAIGGIIVNSRDITERRQAMEQLHESERRYELLFNEMVAAFALHELVCDEQGRLVDYRFLGVNREFERLTGLRKDDVVGRTLRQVLPDTDDAWLQTYQKVALTGAPEHFEQYHAGLQKYFEVTAFSPQRGQLAVTFRDVSGRKGVETALLNSEERYRRLLASTTDYIYTVQIEGGRATTTTHGAGCVAVTGYSAEDYAADPYLWVQMVHPTDRDAVKRQAESALRGEQPPPLEHRILHKDSSVRWLRNTIVLRRDEQGAVVSYDGLVSDITERKRAEIAMRNLVAGTAGVTGSDFFPVLARHLGAALGVRYVFVSEIDEYSPNRLRPLAFVADGKLKPHAAYDTTDAPCGEALTSGELCFIPDRVAEQFPKDSELVAVGARSYMGVPLRSSRDELIGLLCVVDDEAMSEPDRAKDILNVFASRAAAELERQRAEETLRKTNETLRALIESSPIAIVAVDGDSRVMLWNPAAEKMFGWTEDEVLGKPYPVASLDKQGDHASLRDRALRGETVTSVEVRRTTKSGNLIDIAVAVAPLRDAYGKIYAAVGLMADVTERNQVAERLRLQGTALEAAANGIMITDHAGTIVWVNPAFTTLVGYTADEVIGQTPSFLKSGAQSPRFYEEMRSTIDAGHVWHGELLNRRKDGGLFTEEMTITPVRDSTGEISHFIAIKQDVTKRKEAQVALEELQRQQRALLDNIPDIAWLKDRAGKFIAVNHAFGKACGVTPHELVGATDFDIWDKELAERYVADDQEVMLHHLSKRVEEPMTDTEGHEFWVETIRTPIFNDLGDVIGTTGIARDVTDRKHGEETLRETNRRLQEALSGLKAAEQQVIQQERLRALGTMASGIAHDFNNALAAILGFTELLLYRPEILQNHEQSLKYVQMMNTAAKDAGNTVNRLREFYRYREKEDVFVPIQLSQLVEQAISLTQPKWKNQAEAAGISIQVRTELTDLPVITGNAADLREALINLIFNAVDAMPAGGTLTIRTRSDNDCAVIEVSDTGTGMTEGVRQRCLEPFFSTKGERGTGLGLSMVYGIVKRHEGDVEIDTAEGQGTTFRIRLPRRLAHILATTTTTVPHGPTRPLRILLVDDEPQVRIVMQEFLHGDGHTVETASDGREGYEKFQAGTYDIAVLDRAMPRMNGDQLAAAIKSLAPEVVVILLTGFGTMMMADGEKPEGVDYIVSKPVTINELRAAIAQASHGPQ